MDVNVVPPLSTTDQQRIVADWFMAYHAPLHRYLVRIVGNADTAADLLQETFLRALLGLRHQSPPDNPSAWLYRIASNLAFSTLRRQRRFRWLPFRMDEPTVSFETGVITAQVVRDCLARLRPKDAEILLLHAYAGLRSTEIATLLGENASTVRVRLSRACARFEALYTKEIA